MRTGLIGKKLGMARMLTESGQHIPVTLVQVKDCQVVNVKTSDKEGYNAIQVGFDAAKPKRVSKPLKGYFAKQKVLPKKKLVEFRVAPEGLLKTGDMLSVDHFVKGQLVDVSGISIGKGFAGVMKRYNFAGLRASHGVSIAHRSHGSTGQNQDPGRVFKGKKMAGHMGHKRVTIQNLEVVATDLEQQVIVLKGAIPGAKGSYIEIRDAVKSYPGKVALPYPAVLLGQNSVSSTSMTEVEASSEQKEEIQQVQELPQPEEAALSSETENKAE